MLVPLLMTDTPPREKNPQKRHFFPKKPEKPSEFCRAFFQNLTFSRGTPGNREKTPIFGVIYDPSNDPHFWGHFWSKNPLFWVKNPYFWVKNPIFGVKIHKAKPYLGDGLLQPYDSFLTQTTLYI